MAETIPAQERNALVRRLADEILNGSNSDPYAERDADDFVSHRPPRGADAGYSDLESTMTDHRVRGEAVLDVTASIEEIIDEDDLVADRLTIIGTHQGEFLGITEAPGA